VGQCLERGERYAWSVAAGSLRAASLDWSPALLFEVQAAPSVEELEGAMATIRRHLELQGAEDGAPPSLQRASRAGRESAAGAEQSGADAAVRSVARRPSRGLPEGRALVSPSVGDRAASAGAAPTLASSASLAVSSQVHLGAASAVFKEDQLFLWDDASGNTALGRHALATADGNTVGNTAVGRNALTNSALGGGSSYDGSYNTAVGLDALAANTTGYQGTAVGASALESNTTGYRNTATGYGALALNTQGFNNSAAGFRSLYSNDTGSDNTAMGRAALFGNTTGSNNTAVGNLAMTFSNGGKNAAFGAWAMRSQSTGSRNVGVGYRALYFNQTGNANTTLGYKAGYNASGSSNVLINSTGVGGESNVLRIGQSLASGDPPFAEHSLDKAFIQGIRSRTTDINDAIPVVIDSNGQLGTASSSRRLKQDVRDVGELADRLLELRPVAFRYKQHVATDPDTAEQFGLIAEEVAEVLPALVVFDAEGRPETVKYHLLASLLLGEVQRLEERVAELEAAPARGRRRGRR
jgi:hypothetical protein